MPDLKFDDDSYAVAADESILDCLLRNGKAIPYSCKSGVCQACLVKAVGPPPPSKARVGLKPTLQASGYGMACQWVPEADTEVRLPGTEELAITMVVKAMDMLNSAVMRVLLIPRDAQRMFASSPGQYLSLISPDGTTRSYSIANDFAHDGHVELHIGKTERGVFTNWLFNEAKVGEALHARGPAGACYYLNPGESGFPILLAGTGTGLAPLWGIVRDALRRDHKGPITLLHGGSNPDRLYHIDELRGLATNHPNFRYQGVVLSGPISDPALIEGDLMATALAALDSATLSELRVFLCGAPEFVHKLRKLIFLKGVRSAHIFCDAFVSRTITTSA